MAERSHDRRPGTGAKRLRHVLSKSNPAFKDLVEDLGSADRVTLVVGAGASVDASLPLWEELIERLVHNAFKHMTKADVKDLIAKYGRSVCATFVRTKCKTYDDWVSAVRQALYVQDSTDSAQQPYEPGALLREIARLAIGYKDCAIFTTNYDDLLERALDDATRKAGDEGQRYSRPKVEYLHGHLPQDGRARGLLVLDESGYASVREQTVKHLRSRLQRRPTLFVGMSMTDSTIVRALYGKARGSSVKKRHGIFRASVKEDFQIALQRLQFLNVNVLEVNSYEQVAQVLAEIQLRKAGGDSYWDDATDLTKAVRFSQRMEYWTKGIDKKFPLRDPGGTRSGGASSTHDYRQRVIHERLRDFVTTLPGHVGYPELQEGERWSVLLWMRRHAMRRGAYLELWGSSWAYYPERVIDLVGFQADLDRRSTYVAVQAANKGALVTDGFKRDAITRWQSQVGIPIFLQHAPWRRLLVGVLTFGSTRDWNDYPPKVQQDLATAMDTLGQGLADPDVPLEAQ